MKKLYVILISICMLLGCANTSEENEETTTTETEYSMSGRVQDSFCKQGGIVTIWPITDVAGLPTSGNSFPAEIKNDFGEFDVSTRVTNLYVEAFANARCVSEITGATMDYKVLPSIIRLSDGYTHTISPLTAVIRPRLRELYNGSNYDAARSQAESEILILFGLPSITKSFSELNIAGDTTDDAVLILANSMMLINKEEAEQTEFMTRIGQSILDGAGDQTALINELKASQMALPLQTIKDNLNTEYIRLGGEEQDFSKFWEIADTDGDGIPNSQDPDQAVEMDMISRDPVIQGGFKIDDTCSTLFPDSSSRFFAFQWEFDGTIENAKYILLGVDADHVSIYANNPGACGGYDCPLSPPLFTIDKIPVNYFNRTLVDTSDITHDSLPQNFSGDLGVNQIPYGVKVWVVLWGDVNYSPQIGCTGVSLSMDLGLSKNHFSADGVNWFPTGNASIYTQAMFSRMAYTN